MKLAVIAVTNRGAALAENVRRRFPGAAVFVKSGRGPAGPGREYTSLSALIRELFFAYDGLVFIMATGIAVRVIAPYIADKRSDPAVLAMDEAGRYVISLLAGHIGGANELAREVAAQIGAVPVITTATDVNGRPAADVLAVKLDLKIGSFAALKRANAALANGEPVAFQLDETLAESAAYRKAAARLGVALERWEENAPAAAMTVLITDRRLTPGERLLILCPRSLAVGVGCRRGAAAAAIVAAIDEACRRIGRSREAVAVLASVDLKRDEAGLAAAARELAASTVFYDARALQAAVEEHRLTVSNFVHRQIGVGNVCEAAALLTSRPKKILLAKTRFPQITIAIAAVK